MSWRQREKRQSNIESLRTTGEQHTASARAQHATVFSCVLFVAQGLRSMLKVTAHCHHLICALPPREAQPLPPRQPPAQDRERSTSCAMHSAEAEVCLVVLPFNPRSHKLRKKDCVWQKRKTVLKATAKTWLEWSAFLLGPLQCSFLCS